jgi:hypothetical protein
VTKHKIKTKQPVSKAAPVLEEVFRVGASLYRSRAGALKDPTIKGFGIDQVMIARTSGRVYLVSPEPLHNVIPSEIKP